MERPRRYLCCLLLVALLPACKKNVKWLPRPTNTPTKTRTMTPTQAPRTATPTITPSPTRTPSPTVTPRELVAF